MVQFLISGEPFPDSHRLYIHFGEADVVSIEMTRDELERLAGQIGSYLSTIDTLSPEERQTRAMQEHNVQLLVASIGEPWIDKRKLVAWLERIDPKAHTFTNRNLRTVLLKEIGEGAFDLEE